MNWIDNHANALSALGSISSALVALIASIIAAIALRYSRDLLAENRPLRLSGSDPEIVTHLTIDERISNCLNFAVENVGPGPAFDVTFEIKIDETTWKNKNIVLARNIGKVPFTAIPAGRKIESSFALGFDVLSKPLLLPFEASVSYKNLRGLSINKSYIIDARQFENIGRLSPESETQKMGDALRSISRNIENLANT